METPQVDVRAHLGPVGEHALDELHLVARDRRVHEVECSGHHHHLVVHRPHRGSRGEVEVGEALGRVRLRIPVVGDVRRVPDLPHTYRHRGQLGMRAPEASARPVAPHHRRGERREVRHVRLLHLGAEAVRILLSVLGRILLGPRGRVVQRGHPAQAIFRQGADDRVVGAPVVGVLSRRARRVGLGHRPARVGADDREPAARHRGELLGPGSGRGLEDPLAVDAVVVARHGGVGRHGECRGRQRGGDECAPHERISPSTSSRFVSMSSWETSDSRLRRSRGSVLEGRTLKCQSS